MMKTLGGSRDASACKIDLFITKLTLYYPIGLLDSFTNYLGK